MDATSMTSMTSTLTPTATGLTTPARGEAERYLVNVGRIPCEVRVRTIAMISEVLGFEQEMEGELMDLTGDSSDRDLIADMLDSRMIAPPRAVRRRQRPVSSRAMFYAAGGR